MNDANSEPCDGYSPHAMCRECGTILFDLAGITAGRCAICRHPLRAARIDTPPPVQPAVAIVSLTTESPPLSVGPLVRVMADRDALRSRVMQLEEALRPFADAQAALGNYGDGVGCRSIGFWKDHESLPTAGDFRHAHAVLYRTNATSEAPSPDSSPRTQAAQSWRE